MITAAALLLMTALLPSGAGAQQMSSPSGELSLNVECAGGTVTYALTYKGLPVITPSRLGLTGDEADLTSGFSVVSVNGLDIGTGRERPDDDSAFPSV